MKNDIIPEVVDQVPSQNIPYTITIPGNHNTLIDRASNVNLIVNNIPLGRRGISTVQNIPVSICSDFYNLFVIGGETFENDHFLVPKDRALNENSTSFEIRDKLNSLSPEAILKIRSFPSIFASENHRYGKTDDMQTAIYGFVTDIKIQDNGIKIYYACLNYIPQQRLNELAFELGIKGTSALNELNRTHWAIKKINLVEALRDAGIPVLSYQ